MRADKGSHRDYYDNSRRKAQAEHRAYTKMVDEMFVQMEDSENVHPETLHETYKHLNDAMKLLKKVELKLKKARSTFTESPRVRNQRRKRRRESS